MVERDFIALGTVEAARKVAGPPILVALSGLPGTGKSYFARELNQKVPFVLFESDRVRKTLVAKPKYSRGEHARVFQVCHLLIEEYLAKGCRVLFDATNLTEAFRRPLYEICERLGLPLVLVKFSAPRPVVRERLERRSQGLDPTTYSDANWLIYCRMAPYDEPLSDQSTRGRHIRVDTSQDILPAVAKVAHLAA